MNERQRKLTSLILAQALESPADAGQFADITETLNTPSLTQQSPDPISMATTLAALAENGHDPDVVITALEATPTGRYGVAKLATVGLDFGHPLTQALLTQRVAAGAITQAQADVLIGLSVGQVAPAEQAGLGQITESELQTAWRMYRLQQRRINAAALASERLTPELDAQSQLNVWTQAWEDAV